MIPFPAPSSAAEQSGGADISALHSDVMAAHIVTRLDGPTLASITSASHDLRRLCSNQSHRLWLDICHSTWPSTAAPRVTDVISTFPDGGPRAFFAHSFPLPASAPPLSSPSSLPKELISAVDIRYKDELIFSKVHEMETSSSGFEHSPFMVDLVDPKDGIFTQITQPDENAMCASFTKDVTLSWILIDPNNQQVVNLSSYKPVSVHRQWLGGDVRVTFASILLTDHRHVGPAQCGIVVTFDASNNTETLHVWEVSIQMEDIDGNLLNGKDSLLILQMALEGKRTQKKKKRKKRSADRRHQKRQENVKKGPDAEPSHRLHRRTPTPSRRPARLHPPG
ncbi:unnamed protein product [Cuscuta campestris]|uniref:F-box domain-containing protein n=1 Tax=Cuscuta campestris TaxID=132261 RepID=A0A484K7A9_9ASTE|nr:unnamed protein product [Cuscuta campestris]